MESTDDLNTVMVSVSGIVDMSIKIRSIETEENQIHNYEKLARIRLLTWRYSLRSLI